MLRFQQLLFGLPASRIFPWNPFCFLVKLPKVIFSVSSFTARHSFSSKTIEDVFRACAQAVVPYSFSDSCFVLEAMFIQYDTTSIIVLGIDTQILFHGNVTTVVFSGHSNWDVNVWVVGCIVLYHTHGEQKTYAEKDEADVQREAEARKSMIGMESRDQD